MKPTKYNSDISRPRQSSRNREKIAVNSYYGQAQSQERRLEKKAEKTIDLSKVGNKLRLIPAVIAITVIIGSLLISATLTVEPAVSVLPGQESPYRTNDEYAAGIEKILNDKPSNKTKFTINTGDIEDEIIKAYPEVRVAAVRLPVIGRKPTVLLDIRQPKIILASNTKNFVLDKTGIAVSEVRLLSSEDKAGMPIVQDQNNIEFEVGKQALPADTVEFILGAKFQLEQKEYKISQLTLPTGVNELHIHLEGLPYYIKTDTTNDVRQQVGGFLSVKEHLAGNGIAPSEYVDVRVEEKVFYK